MEPEKYNSAYNTEIKVNPPSLQNPTSIVIESMLDSTGKSYTPTNYIALNDNVTNIDNLDKGMISSIQMLKPKQEEGFEPHDKLQFTNVPETPPDFFTKFYIGSITIVGLYIFYRIMVKNK